MYNPFFVSTFQSQSVFREMISKEFVKTTKKMINSLVHMPVMHDKCSLYWQDNNYENFVGKFASLNISFSLKF